ncbi:MAG: glycosyltransferase family 4 protein [Phycisphaerae bacterium]|nr:glycosyltransferase family 4 protein [Phycisphaerae bacterium]
MTSVAYLTSQYPGISHSFVQREILALRRIGLSVPTCSIRRPPADQPRSTIDAAEEATTFYVLPAPPVGLMVNHLVACLTRPVRYVRALWCALTVRPPGRAALFRHLCYFAEAVRLWRELRRRKIQRLHVHFAMSCATVAMIAAELGELQFSLTVHGPSVFYQADRYLLRQKMARAAAVFCISDFCRSQIMALSDPADWAKLKVIHCGIEPETFDPPPDARASRTGPIRILNVARLAPVKGQSWLIEAVAALAAKGHDVTCTIVGDGPERRRLTELVRHLGVGQRIHFVGYVDQDRIQKFYDEADIFVAPSLAEGLPVVLMEAMAKSLPVVATAIMGIPEIVQHGRTGLLVTPGRIEPLVDAVERLIGDAAMRQRMGAAGREAVRQRFDVRDSAQELAMEFAAIVSPRADSQASIRSGKPGEAIAT